MFPAQMDSLLIAMVNVVVKQHWMPVKFVLAGIVALKPTPTWIVPVSVVVLPWPTAVGFVTVMVRIVFVRKTLPVM